MPLIPSVSTDLTSQGIPNAIVQTVPPQPILNSVPTYIIGACGTATYGAVNSPTVVGSIQQEVALFGAPTINKYDLGTVVMTAMNQGATSFICVRVTDGTDVAASIALLDTLTPNAGVGAHLTAKYTGTLGNTINATIGIGSSYTVAVPTFKLSIFFQGGIIEVFDNIGGSGNVFWQNLVSAVQNGQSISRGPSQIVIASLGSGIGAVTITAAGVYVSIPTLTATVGSGAVLTPVMKALSGVIATGGSGYIVGDTITLSGGTSTTATVLTVSAVSSGAITTFTVTTVGAYTVLPANPVSQASTTGSGTGATFTMAWGIASVIIANGGAGYNSSSVLNVSSGAAAGTLTVGSIKAPAQASYVAAGGTDGNSGVTDGTLIGDDTTTPRKGMYAFRGSLASIIVLSDQYDPTYWPTQVEYSNSADLPYMINTLAPGYQENIAGASLVLQNTALDTPYFKLCTGDWVQVNDTFNNQVRFVSPQGTIAGELAVLPPSNSTLNKLLTGVIATQKTADNKIYSDADLYQLKTGRLEVISRPIPLSQSAFGCRLGINISSNPLTNQDNYPRMIYFLGRTILTGMGTFIGQIASAQDLLIIQTTISAYLTTLWKNGLIGIYNDPQAIPFSVVLNFSNNPPDQVALGILRCDATVTIFSIIQQLIVNLNASQNIQTVQAANPVPLPFAA